MGIYTAPGQVVFGQNALPQRLGNEPLRGLGYRKLGENRSGIAGVKRFNSNSAAGRQGPGRWSVKGNFFSGPSDAKLAEWVYRFQHDYQNCPGKPSAQSLKSKDNPWDVYRAIDYCKNRDGMIGHATMCQIVQAIAKGMPFWGPFWAANLDPKQNLAHYTTHGAEGCSFLCGDVACDKRAVTNCPPCGDKSANRIQTGAHNETNDGRRAAYQPPPNRETRPSPQPRPRPQPLVKEEESNMMLWIGGAGLAGVAVYYVGKKKGWWG